MSKANTIESSEKTVKRGFWGLRLAVFTLIVVTGTTAVIGCYKPSNNTVTTPTAIETLTPTEGITPAEEASPTITGFPTEIITPVSTPTEAITSSLEEPTQEPTPLLTPTETPIPTPKPEDRDVAYDELTTSYNISESCFGEEESFDKEVEKRTDYYGSFNFLSDEEIRIYLAYSNINNPNSTLKISGSDMDGFVNTILKICQYNNKKENANKQCLLIYGAIGESLNETERLVISTIQRDMFEAMNNGKYSRKVKEFYESSIY